MIEHKNMKNKLMYLLSQLQKDNILSNWYYTVRVTLSILQEHLNIEKSKKLYYIYDTYSFYKSQNRIEWS